ncbi:MAG: DDE-type integrase/transposase/recombinase [Rhodobacteraceae bacterium]|nr:DDE-type integrase/transposase/recombinase [Paracoccaceae bacterium]
MTRAVPTWSGTVYVAFVIDVFVRRIVGWRASTSMKTQFVLHFRQICAVHRRSVNGRAGAGDLAKKKRHHKDLARHSGRGSQYLSTKNTERLAEAEIDLSAGAVGDAWDSALAECVIGMLSLIDFEQQQKLKLQGVYKSRGCSMLQKWMRDVTPKGP